MPYKIEKVKLPRELDRRVKLTDQERDEIKENIDWLSQRKLAQKYKVSRRLISFIQDPSKLERVRDQYKERRKDWRYYNKEKHREYIKGTRKYKHSLGYDTLKAMQDLDD